MTEHAAPPDAPTAEHIASGLARISQVLKNRSWKTANTQNLSPTQQQILRHLNRLTGHQSNLNDLARELGVTAATTSDAVRVLNDKGLIYKTRDPANARSLVLGVTDAGRELAARGDGPPDFLLTAVQSLSPAEQFGFLKGLIGVIYQMQRQGEIPVARICPTCIYFRLDFHPDPERPHHCAYVDAPFGNAALRLDCAEHEAASSGTAEQAWQTLQSTWP
jgi:DNA-binding MarR family transcriptional regulator